MGPNDGVPLELVSSRSICSAGGGVCYTATPYAVMEQLAKVRSPSLEAWLPISEPGYQLSAAAKGFIRPHFWQPGMNN